VRVEGGAVVENYGGPCCEGRDEPVPHHPGCGCEVEHAVAWPYIAVEDVLFFVLD